MDVANPFSELPRGRRAELIRQFLLENVEKQTAGVATIASRRFGVSRQAVNRQLSHLVDAGLLEVTGTTKGRKYALRLLDSRDLWFEVAGLHEDEVWTERFAAAVADLPPNVKEICYYGFTEMLNNVIDHSGSSMVNINLMRTAVRVRIAFYDSGVGIFRKIQAACNLETPRLAVFELTKGKFTTDPERHTGEGIFFTSRVFDSFSVLSADLYLAHNRGQNDWLLEDRERQSNKGTSVFLEITPDSRHAMQEVFSHYATEQDDYVFNRTTIAVKLAMTPGEQLISRSQAKRIMSRLERFKEVYLDFADVSSIGPAFADEIFRVFTRQHPHTALVPVNTDENVTRMIRRASAAALEQSQSKPDPQTE